MGSQSSNLSNYPINQKQIKKMKQLTVITLNYSGILLSPFQFYTDVQDSKNITDFKYFLKQQLKNSINSQDYSTQLGTLNKIFQRLLQKRTPSYIKFKQSQKKKQDQKKLGKVWELGNIDKQMQKQRFTPIYNPHIGISDNKLMNSEQFKNKWNQIYQENIKKFPQLKVNKDNLQDKINNNKDNTRQFDLMCYKTILIYIKKISQIKRFKQELSQVKRQIQRLNSEITKKSEQKQQLKLKLKQQQQELIKKIQQTKSQKFNQELRQEQIQKLDTSEYQRFMNNMFNKSFLDQQKKIQKTLNYLQNIDIAFIQQSSQNLIRALQKNIKKYHVISQSNQTKNISIIILKRKSFQNFYSQWSNPLRCFPQLKKQLQWNNCTVVGFVDNFILISGFLSGSNKSIDYLKMILSLKKLQTLFPMLHIIVGCDTNSEHMFFYPQKIPSKEKLQTLEKKFKQMIEIQKKQPGKKKIKLKQNKKKQKKQKNENENIQNADMCKKIKLNWQIYPHRKQQDIDIFYNYTTNKKRTLIQPQTVKANIQNKQCRDYIILIPSLNDSQMRNQKICTITNKDNKEITLLPCEEHPYDHYLVKAQIVVNNETNL